MARAARTVSSLTMALLALAVGAPACAQSLAGKAELCDACHGVNGIPPDPMMPARPAPFAVGVQQIDPSFNKG
jgi:hypothetical protein